MKSLKQKENGFFSVDALFAMILLLLVIGTFVNIYQGRSEMATETRKNLEGKMIGEKLAGAINTVYSTGDPLILRIDLPENIVRSKYSICFESSSREVTINSGETEGGPKIASSWSVPDEVEISDLNFSEKIQIFWENSKIRVKNL